MRACISCDISVGVCGTTMRASRKMQAVRLNIAELLLFGVLLNFAAGDGKVRYWGRSILPPVPQSAINATAIASGANHVLTLKNGSIISWGNNAYHQLDVPSDIQGHVKQIACVQDRSLALLDNATVVCWGNCVAGIPPAIKGHTVSIKGMQSSSAAKLQDGSWFVWSDLQTWVVDSSLNATDVIETTWPQGNLVLLSNGTLLTATSANLGSSALQYSQFENNVTAACFASDQAITLSTDGSLTGTISDQSFAVNAVDFEGLYTAPLVCGSDGIFVNLLNGSLASWNTTLWPNNVSLISYGSPIRMVTVGDTHHALLLSNGTIILIGELQKPDQLPSIVRAGIVKDISAGGLVAGAILQNGSLVGWGSWNFCDNRSFTAVSAGYDHLLGLTDTGEVIQWGLEDAPVPADMKSGVTAVSAGSFFNMAVKNGTISVWGNGVPSTSQTLGDVQTCNLTLPYPEIQGFITQVSAGTGIATALLKNTSVVVWGCIQDIDNSIPPEAHANVIQISAGRKAMNIDRYSSIFSAVLGSGRLVVWKSEIKGLPPVTSVPQVLTLGIVAGEQYTENSVVALTKEGKAVVFDANAAAKPMPDPNSNIARLAVGNGSFVMGIEDESAFSPPSPPPSPSPSPPPPPSPLPHITLPPKTTTKNTVPASAVAGAVVGSCVLLLLLVGAFYRMRFAKKSKASLQGQDGPGYADLGGVDGISRVCVDGNGGLGKAMDIPGIMKGDVFTRATAYAYSWVRDGLNASQLGSIEAGINDYLLDMSATNGIVPPAIELSMQQIQEQILLLRDGLLGRGATALVFKCLWPARFGKDSALAIKVLNDGYSLANDVHLQSFSYEASVLSSLYPPHPNVVRLYGYCMEPPTVCLILELLPSSLKSLLRNETGIQNLALPPKVTSMQDKLPMTFPLLQDNVATSYITSSSDATTSTASSTVGLTVTSTVRDSQKPQATTPKTASTVGDTAASVVSSVDVAMNECAVPPLNMQQVCSISLDIAAGLKYLHSKPFSSQDASVEASETMGLVSVQEEGAFHQNEGASVATNKTFQIVHRDLKPANILMNSQGTAKISDFGLARPHDRETLMTDHIGAGTLPYMPPELLMGAHVKVAAAIGATNRVDIYSTAMIMWEMLAGRAPWSNCSGDMIQAAVLNGRRPELPIDNKNANNVQTGSGGSMFLANVPASLNALPEFNAIIRACWQQRDHRRPSAAVLHDMLSELMKKHGNNPNVA